MWSSRPVFVSSTFQDMQAERDHLRYFVFPAIEERLRAYGRNLEWVDLRIGVAGATLADESARELQVLKVCLDEVRRCRPFLIVLLGDRYGWVPPASRVEAAAREAGLDAPVAGRSVTDLEIDLGVLRNRDQQTRSRFYFRAPLPYEAMPAAVRAGYADDDGDAARPFGRRAAALKARIQDALPDRVRWYAAEWDARSQRVTGLEAWGRQVTEDIWAEIEAELAVDGVPAVAPLEAFIQEAARDFVGRRDLLARAVALSRGPADAAGAWGLCITGEAGAGKSAVFARICQQLQSAGEFVLAHAVGSDLQSSSVDAMLRTWIARLADRVGVESGIDARSDADAVDRAFAALLARASAEQRVTLVIDALDQFEATTRGRFMTWMPRDWPRSARLIATSIPCDASAALAGRAGVETAVVPPLGAAEARAIIDAICQRYHRTLDPEVVESLLAKMTPTRPAWANPLWLVLATEALNLVDADDLAGAWQREGRTPAEQLRAMLLERVSDLATDVPGLYAATFARAERAFGAIFTATWLSLIACGRAGWRELDFSRLLPELTGEPWDALRSAQLRRFFRGQIKPRGSVGQLDFAHAQMREAVRAHPMASSLPAAALHAAIARHLRSLPDDDPLRGSETMAHLLAAGDWAGAAMYLGGDLSPREIDGTTSVLLDASRQSSLDRLLSAESADVDYREFAAQRLMYFVFDRLRERAPVDVLEQLARTLVGAFEGFRDAMPDAYARETGHLGAACGRLADILAERGAAAEAQEWHRKALDLIAKSVERQRPEDLHDLSVGHNKVGALAQERGDLEAALAEFRAGLAAIEAAVAAEPDNVAWRRDLAQSHRFLIDVHFAMGNLAEAEESLERCQDIERRLSARPGAGLEDRFGVAINEDRAAKLHEARGDLAAADECRARARAQLEILVARDPSNVHWLHALFAAETAHGQLQHRRGEDGIAAASLAVAVEHGQRLLAHDPDRIDWRRDVSIARIALAACRHNVSYVALSELENGGDQDAQRLSRAQTAVEAAIAAVQMCAPGELKNPTARERLQGYYHSLQLVQAQRGDLVGAQESYRALRALQKE